MNLLFGFQGRIGRGKWWLAQLAGIVCLVLLGVVTFSMAVSSPPDTSLGEDLSTAGLGTILVVLALLVLMFWINAASTVKRFHDRNKSGAWFFISFVPYVGGLWIMVECGCLKGSPGSNTYGPAPAGMSSQDLDDIFGPDKIASYAMPAEAPRPQRAPGASASVPSVRCGPAQAGFGRRGL